MFISQVEKNKEVEQSCVQFYYSFTNILWAFSLIVLHFSDLLNMFYNTPSVHLYMTLINSFLS